MVSLDDLFGDAHVAAVEEMALDGAQRLSDVRRLRWRAGDSITRGDGDRPSEAASAAAGLTSDAPGQREVRILTSRRACCRRQRAVGHAVKTQCQDVGPESDAACHSDRRTV